MCPLVGRRYYKWMIKVNNGFLEAVSGNKDLVLELLRSGDVDLVDVATQLGIIGDDQTELANYVGSIPAEVQRTMRYEIAQVVEEDGDVFFDWGLSSTWSAAMNQLPPVNGESAGLVVVLYGPFDVEGSLTGA